MPRSPTILTPPPGILPFTPNTTIRSQDANALFNDLYQDGNTPRPIVYGGTGANNALDALTNLGAISQDNFLDAYSIGDFYDTVRTLDSAWLKRDGSLHLRADYPELADLLPALPDGVSWRSISGLGSLTTRSLLAESGRIILVSQSGSATDIYSSVDGQTFSTIATIPSFAGISIAKGNGIYVMVGNGNACISNNAIDWSAPATVSSNGFTSVYFGGGIFVAIGLSGSIYTSPDGIVWTSRTSGTSQTLWSGLYGNSMHLITGDNGVILTSPDGSSWTSRSSGTTNALYSSAYGEGLYVVAGFQSIIRSSPDGVAWTARSSGVSVTSLTGMTHSSSGFVAVGSNGTAILSTNGMTWTPTITGVSASLNLVVFDPDNPSIYYAANQGNVLIEGTRTLPTQFKTPSDSPQYGWIKALEEAP